MRSAGLDELQAGIKIDRRNINSLRIADDTSLMAESGNELKSLLRRVKEESGRSWLKTVTGKDAAAHLCEGVSRPHSSR